MSRLPVRAEPTTSGLSEAQAPLSRLILGLWPTVEMVDVSMDSGARLPGFKSQVHHPQLNDWGT